MATVKKSFSITDILKSENSEATRIWVKARGNEILGFAWHDFLNSDGTKRRLLVLSAPENGKVLLQPQNCTISLRAFSNLKEVFNKYRGIGGKPSATFKDEMIAEGRKYGISYVDFPKS